MKKLKVIIAAAGLLIAVGAYSQAPKIAYIRIDDIVGLMPEVQKVNMDTVGQKFVQDSIMPRLNYVQSEYNRKLQDLADTVNNPPGVRAQILKDLQAYRDELDNAQSLLQQVYQYKQNEFLQPYYLKAKTAIQQVAKEKNYTHVFSTDVFIVAPEADDISLAVLSKLNIKLPEKPAANGGGAAANPAGSK